MRACFKETFIHLPLLSPDFVCKPVGDEDSSTNIVFVCIAQKFTSTFNTGKLKELSELQALRF